MGVLQLTSADPSSKLQARPWWSVGTTLLPESAQLSHEQKLRPAFVHSKSEPQLKNYICICVYMGIVCGGRFERHRV